MRVLLLEDEPDLGAAIARTLEREKYVVDWVTDGEQAWQYLEDKWTQYTLGIFDWLVPEMSGLELCQRLRRGGSSLPILMLTAKDRMEDKVTGLDAGADDYLVKPFGMVELLARLRALQRRAPQFQPQQLTVGNFTLDYASYSVSCQTESGRQQAIALTNKEFQLLEYLMTHRDLIVSTEQLRYQLWDVGSDAASNVVAAQMRLLRRKLAEFGAESAIETVRGIGYRFSKLS